MPKSYDRKILFNISCVLEYSQQRTFQTSIFDKSEIVLKNWTQISKKLMKTRSMNIEIKRFAEKN